MIGRRLDPARYVLKVLPFLEPEVAELYDIEAWDQMQTFVAEQLEARR